MPIAGIGTGAYVMAKAGLLDGHHCTVHWENMAGFREVFPDLDVRLRRARILLSQTSLSVLEVAVACGFASASHFAKCYRSLFGRPPRQERTEETRARRSGPCPAATQQPAG